MFFEPWIRKLFIFCTLRLIATELGAGMKALHGVPSVTYCSVADTDHIHLATFAVIAPKTPHSTYMRGTGHADG